ncbi:phage terminase large subunit family protein [Pectobacterium carotovorum]|uniref:phage terminase large subunit family protein n=1 Tax=Pectobacterium brasiliense TaxID=180957 RepID=UPI002351C25D|nr:phage terminase large subunit family protein [Pectobacterium carotovorum]
MLWALPPTVKGTSRIEKSYEESDQRRYYVPCPHCGEYQILEWGWPDTPYGIKWDKDENGDGLLETAYYVCRHNGCVLHHNEKAAMVKRGEWRASKPFSGHAGFHIWAVAGICGSGSILHNMMKAYLANDSTAEIWLLPLSIVKKAMTNPPLGGWMGD